MVENVVNRVGVDVNTASPALLTYVAGIGPKLAEKIVAYRDENGPFPPRRAAAKCPGLGPKAFEQAAGFLRIRGGKEPLDATAIHPESYAVARGCPEAAGVKPAIRYERRRLLAQLHAQPASETGRELGVGVPTLTDILGHLVRPGRDPRADAARPDPAHDVLKMEDLARGDAPEGHGPQRGRFRRLRRHRRQAGRPAAPHPDAARHQHWGWRRDRGEIVKVEVERGRIALGWE